MRRNDYITMIYF